MCSEKEPRSTTFLADTNAQFLIKVTVSYDCTKNEYTKEMH